MGLSIKDDSACAQMVLINDSLWLPGHVDFPFLNSKFKIVALDCSGCYK